MFVIAVAAVGCGVEANSGKELTGSLSSEEKTSVGSESSHAVSNPDSAANENNATDKDATDIRDSKNDALPDKKEQRVRFATFNVAMNRKKEGQLKIELASGKSAKTEKIAEIIQRIRPDVLLLNEFDYDADGQGVESFQKEFLGKPHHGQKPIEYDYVYFQSVNTGVDSKLDLNNDGKLGTANDAYGYGDFPGQYGMVVLSKYPIDWEGIRTFQNFLWKDMPDCQWPTVPTSGKPYYQQEVRELFRLSSKSHWDVPIKIDEKTVHFLVAHPTPPVFDDEEDRNGCRNHDEIRFWADYVSGQPSRSEYIYDDNQTFGGLDKGEKFVIAGDMNADPVDGDSSMQAASQLTEHALIDNSFTPKSDGGAYFAKSQGRANDSQQGNPSFDTGDFNDLNVGNMRVDYCLPSKSLKTVSSGVFWPKPDQPGGELVGASDHRMVWIDIVK